MIFAPAAPTEKIKDIKLFFSSSTEEGLLSQPLAEVTLINGIVQRLSWASLQDYWPYAKPTEIEYATASYSGSFAIFCLTVASGQGGIIAVWNVVEHRWQHISNASYVLSALLIEKINAIVSLHFIQSWGAAGGHMIEVRRLDNTKNSFAEISSPLTLPPKGTVIELREEEMRSHSWGSSDGKSLATSGLFLLVDDITIVAQDAGHSYRFSVEDVQQSLPIIPG